MELFAVVVGFEMQIQEMLIDILPHITEQVITRLPQQMQGLETEINQKLQAYQTEKSKTVCNKPQAAQSENKLRSCIVNRGSQLYPKKATMARHKNTNKEN